MFSKILVPLDGSKLAERALKPAFDLTRSAGSEIILLRVPVLMHMMMSDVATEYGWLWPDQSLEKSQAESIEYLDDVRSVREEPGVKVTTRVIVGDEASVIVDTAAEEAVDLIVMSTHGYTGLTRWMLGSVAEKVLRSAPCPVMVIRSADPITRILITLDGSQLAEQALEPGLEVARRLRAQVTLLRVDQVAVVKREELMQLDLAEKGLGERFRESVYERADAYVNEVARRCRRLGLEVKSAALHGPPAPNILDFAAAEDMNLIVMVTHGRTGLQRWVYGSVTAKVLHGSESSMMIIRPAAHELN